MSLLFITSKIVRSSASRQTEGEGKNAEILKKITDKIDQIEATKKSQSSFRNISIIVIIVLIAILVSRLNTIADELKNNQQAIVQQLKKMVKLCLKQTHQT